MPIASKTGSVIYKVSGRGIKQLDNYYVRSTSGTSKPLSGWSTTPPTLTETYRYLWNYERIIWTDGGVTETEPHVIGVYGDAGRGISSIAEYYLATNKSSGVTTSTSGWSTSIPTMTSTNRYLWNYERVYYTDGSYETTRPVMIGVYGEKGEPGDKGDPGEKGEPGDKGERGPSIRGPQDWDKLANGFWFECGKEGEDFIDLVIKDGNYYQCIQSHSKTAARAPGSATSYWEAASQLNFVATYLLLSAYALIENLGVTAIEMKDSYGNTVFYAKDGIVKCNTGIFNDIDVQSGKIAGFKISGNGLSNDPFTNDAYVIFRNDARKAFAGIGGNVLSAISGARGVARFENHDETDTWGLGINYAVLASARGTRDNRALQLDGGTVCGMAMRNTIINTGETSKTLTRYDYNVVAINSSDCIVTLPTMQLYDDGHVIRIKRLGTGKVFLKLGYCYTYNGNSSRYTRPCLVYDQNLTLTGTNTLEISSEGDSMELVWVRDLTRVIGSSTYYGMWIQYKIPRDW